jgi:hypothetical protein
MAVLTHATDECPDALWGFEEHEKFMESYERVSCTRSTSPTCAPAA